MTRPGLRGLFVLILSAFAPALALARPLLTEEVPTVGRHAFETTLGLSKRYDQFGSPKLEYDTVNFPIQARFGLNNKLDLGLVMNYVSQRLETSTAHYAGSQNNRLSLLAKYSPSDYAGFMFIYHTRQPEQGVQNLPVARGEDLEAVALFGLPIAWPVNLNVGYIKRGAYKTKLGVSNGPAYKIEPGDIFESKLSLEVPIRWHIYLLGEFAYYNMKQEKVADVAIQDSAGDALDGLIGLTWSYAGWNLGVGAAAGLLDERHTSFDYEHGAGDIMYKAAVSYKLVAKRPER